jgi:CxxC-x17-CxxC domain-containing protein
VSFTDKVLTCRDCGEQFTWTAGEQEFYQSRGLLNPPTRCPSCRAARKSAQGGGGGGGGYSTRSSYGGESSGYSGGGGGGYSGGGGGYSDRPPRQMFEAVCADCGQPTQVPFQPRGDRPVYCRDCFQKRRASGY